MISELLVVDCHPDILVIDDNSPDGTGELVIDFAKNEKRVNFISRSGKLGLGTAYVAGFTWALDNNYDVIIQMDADFSHLPQYIPSLVAALDSYDIAVGSRYVTGGGVDKSWSWSRKFLSKSGNTYARLVTGVTVHDATSGFKAFRAEALKKIPLDKVSSDGYSFQMEMAFLSKKANLQVCEIPIIFYDRTKGKSKMSLGIIWEAIWKVWWLGK